MQKTFRDVRGLIGRVKEPRDKIGVGPDFSDIKYCI